MFLWISTIALALTDIYAPYSSVKEDPHIWTVAESAFFWAFKWFIWGLFIVWLIFACHYGYAGEKEIFVYIRYNNSVFKLFSHLAMG